MNTVGGIVGIVTCLLKSALLVHYILAIKTGPTVIGCALFRLKHVIQLQTSVRTSGKKRGKLLCEGRKAGECTIPNAARILPRV